LCFGLIGIIADTHIRGKDWEDKKLVLTQLKEQISAHNVRYLLNAGDLFDQGRIGDKYVSAGVITSWLSDWLSSQDIALISIEGNHDQTTNESAFDVFRHPQQIVIKNDVRWISIQGHYFICIPWLTNNRVGCDARLFAKEMIRRCYQEIASLSAYNSSSGSEEVLSVNLLGHLDAVGAAIRNHVAITSEEYSKFAFDLSILEKEMQCQFSNVYLGHIHSRQPVKMLPRVIRSVRHGHHGYIGYTSPLGFGETKNPFGWLEFDGLENTFHQLDAPEYYHVSLPDLGKLASSEGLKPWDHLRVSGEGAAEFAALADCKHKEVIGETLHLQTVQSYLEKKDSTFKEIFNEWLGMAGLELADRTLVDEYLEQINVKWDSLTGRMSRIKSIGLFDVGPHASLRLAFTDGVTAIVGENGKGKSWAAEAFPFAAFGQWITPRGTNAQFMGKRGWVEVEFEIDDREYKVVRTSKEMTLFNENGIEVTKGLKKTSRQFLETLIGDKDNFLHCSFVSQNGKFDIIETDPSARMEMLRYFLKLDVFDNYLEEVKELLKTNRVALQSAENDLADEPSLRSAIDEVVGKVSRCESELASEQGRASSLQHTIDLFSQEHENQVLYKTKERQLKEALSKLNYLEEERADAEADKVNHPVAALPDYFTQKESERSELEDRLGKAERSEARIKSLRVLAGDSKLKDVGCAPNYLPCPLIDKFLDAKKELDSTDTKDSPLANKMLTELRKMSEEVASSRAIVQSLAALEYAITKNETALKQQLIKVDNLQLELSEIVVSDEVYDVPLTMRKLSECNRLIGDLRYSLGKYRQQMESMNEQTAEIEATKSTIAELRYRVESYELLERAFSKSGISHYLASSALPELQEIFNSLLQVSFDERLKIVFENIATKGKSIKESFSIIKTNSRKPHDVRHCSGGEKAVLKMLWKLTLLVYQSRRNEGYRCLILDEPTAWMDDENVEATIKMLQHVSERFDQIIMVTHSHELAQMADHIITL